MKTLTRTALALAAGLMVLSCGSNTSSGNGASGNDVTETEAAGTAEVSEVPEDLTIDYTYRYSGTLNGSNDISMWFCKRSDDKLAGQVEYEDGNTFYLRGHIERGDVTKAILDEYDGEISDIPVGKYEGQWYGAGNFGGTYHNTGNGSAGALKDCSFELEDMGGEDGMTVEEDPFFYEQMGAPQMDESEFEPKILSNDEIEHEVTTSWFNSDIKVEPRGSEPDINDFFEAVYSKYPMPLLDYWKRIYFGAVDNPDAWWAKGSASGNDSFICGDWTDPDKDRMDKFFLKSFKGEDGNPVIGLEYQYQWDGDDGMGVYELLCFWKYDPKSSSLKPLERNGSREYPNYEPYRGYSVWSADSDRITFEHSEAGETWIWNGTWFNTDFLADDAG